MCKIIELLLIPNPWHPSVLENYGVALWVVIMMQSRDRVWLGGKSDAGVAIPAALDASEIRIRFVGLASGLSPLSLCLSLLCEWLFKGGQAFLSAQSASKTFSLRLQLPTWWGRYPLTDVFVSQLESGCPAFALCHLTVEEILGDPAVLHVYHMPQPALVGLAGFSPHYCTVGCWGHRLCKPGFWCAQSACRWSILSLLDLTWS